MRILLLTSFFPPTHTAGTEKRTFGYARILLELGHSVQVLCAGDWDSGEHYWNGYSDEIYQNIPVRRIHLNWQKSPDPNAYLFDNPQTARFLNQCLVEWKPDLIHITSCITLSSSILGVAKQHGLPVVLTLTDFWFVCHKLSLLKYDGTLCNGITTNRDCIRCLSWNSNVYKKLRVIFSEPVATLVFDVASRVPLLNRQHGLRGMALNISRRKKRVISSLNAADVVIAPSKHLSRTFQKIGVKKEISIIQSGHDLSWLDKGSTKTISSRIRFGYIGQFIPSKGVHVLLHAFGSKNWHNQAELHLYGSFNGDPTYWDDLQKIENRNPGAIYFHEDFPHRSLGEVLSGLDVLIVPSLWHENNPRVIQEAFAGKTAVIASDVGGIAEYVQHELNGLLFQRGDSDDLAKQIQRLLGEPDLLAKIKKNIPTVKNIREEVQELEDIYRQLLSRSEASR